MRSRSTKQQRGKRRQDRRQPTYSNWLPVLIAIATIGAYITSFNGVLMFDEIPRIEKSEQIHGLWPLSRMLPGRRPLVTFTLALNYQLSRLDVRSYHAVNLAVHVLAALTLYGILRRTLLKLHHRARSNSTDPSRERKRGVNAPVGSASGSEGQQLVARGSPGSEVGPGVGARWLAASAALIWAVHPLQTQSVTYIIQRGESLMGLFYLLTIYCVLRGADSVRSRAWYTAAVSACALGMCSKAVMVTAPLVVLLYDATFIAGSIRGAVRRRWGLYLGLAATWSILGALGIVRGVLDSTAEAATVGFGYKGVTPLQYLLTQCEVIVHYLRLSFLPVGLCLDYAWPAVERAGHAVPSGSVIAALLAGTVWCLVRHRALGFLGAWFFIVLAPTSSFVPIKDLAFEHRMYLPLAAVVTLAVAGWQSLVSRIHVRQAAAAGLVRRSSVVALVAVVGALGYATADRNTDYHSRLAMWRDVTAKRPQNARAYSNLGVALMAEGRFEEAIAPCEHAVKIEPSFAGGHYRLAQALKRTGRMDQAVEAFSEAIRLDPRYEEARIDRGNTYYDLRRFEEAIEDYRTVMRINPANVGISVNLGNALGSVGRFDEALAAYREALKIKPDWVEARFYLATRLHTLGRLDEAITEYREVLRQRPGHADARRALEAALAGHN
ncbi:MAG: tetratricopeptide repeat protein [Phycisphaerae bacterium]